MLKTLLKIKIYFFNTLVAAPALFNNISVNLNSELKFLIKLSILDELEISHYKANNFPLASGNYFSNFSLD